MNILLATGIYPPEIGGPATFAPAFAEAAKVMGHRIEVITYGDTQTRRTDPWRVEIVSRQGTWIWRYARYAWRCFWMARSADVVFTMGAVSEGLPTAIAAMFARKPFFLRVPGDYAWEQYMNHLESTTRHPERVQQREGSNRVFESLVDPSAFLGNAHRDDKVVKPEMLDEFLKQRHDGQVGIMERMERWVAKRAQKIITPSAYLASVVERWGVPRDRVDVVYSGIEALPVTSTDREALRFNRGFTNETVIMTVARAVPWKRVDLLIEALARSPADRVLVVLGDGPLLASWKELAKKYGVEKRVRFEGRVSRQTMADWYAMADVFALPSMYEGFPHTVYEAVSVGLPCLVSDRTGNVETRQLFLEHVTMVSVDSAAPWAEVFSQPWARLHPIDPPKFQDAAQRIIKLFFVCLS